MFTDSVTWGVGVCSSSRATVAAPLINPCLDCWFLWTAPSCQGRCSNTLVTFQIRESKVTVFPTLPQSLWTLSSHPWSLWFCLLSVVLYLKTLWPSQNSCHLCSDKVINCKFYLVMRCFLTGFWFLQILFRGIRWHHLCWMHEAFRALFAPNSFRRVSKYYNSKEATFTEFQKEVQLWLSHVINISYD